MEVPYSSVCGWRNPFASALPGYSVPIKRPGTAGKFAAADPTHANQGMACKLHLWVIYMTCLWHFSMLLQI